LVITYLVYILAPSNSLKPIADMSAQSTKQLMQDLQATLKDLKNLQTDRSKMLQNLKTKPEVETTYEKK